MLSQFRTAIACIVLALPTGAQAASGTTFFDDFDTLDSDRWYVSDGWANGEWQNCTWVSEAVDVVDGILRLKFLPEATGQHQYSCAEIQTPDHFSYGTFEARMKTDRGSGLNAAFFTYIGPHHDKPHHEIDFEVLTRNTDWVDLNTYVDGEAFHGKPVPVEGSAHSDYRVYSFIWEPDRLRWFIDGKLMHEATTEDGPLPSIPQKIYFSHWGTDTLVEWMGPFRNPRRTVTMSVDWVAYTKLGQGCQFASSVLCKLN